MSEFKNQMKKGLFWTAIDKYSGQVVSIVISMILARLLTPYDFGVVATASVLLGFLGIFSSIGIGPAIIQRNDLSQEDLDNIFSFTVFLGLCLGAVSFSTSWFIADFYKNPQLCPIVQILSVGMFLGALNMVPGSLMSKNLRFKEAATRSLAFQVFFGLIGIIAAFYGAGVYALICPQIISSLCTFLYNNHFYPVRFRRKISLTPIKKIYSFSLYVFLFELFNYFSRNLDKLIIGKFLSAEALGYYEKSYRMMQMPMNNITSVIYPVMQPVMSKLQDNLQEMARKFNKIIFIISTASFPIAVLLYFNASDIINVMYGDKWDAAIPAFKVLALSIPTTLILNPVGPVYLAANASKQMFWVGIVNTAMDIIGFTAGAYFGGTIEAIAWGWTGPSLFAFLFSYTILYHKVLNSSLLVVFKQLIKPLGSAVLLVFFYLIYDVIGISLCTLFNLIIKLGLGVLILLIYLRMTHTFNIIEFVKNKIKRNKYV